MIEYEWDVEEVAEFDTESEAAGDIVEHWFQTSFADAKKFALTKPSTDCKFEIVLVSDDSLGRTWAYLQPDGTLSHHFYDAAGHKRGRVPLRFHEEVRKAQTVTL